MNLNPIRLWPVLSAILASNMLYAQTENFENISTSIKEKLIQNVWYNDQLIDYVQISRNGNVEIATLHTADTLKFNLLLLHPIQQDSGHAYQLHGFGLFGRSIDLYVEDVQRSEEWNDKGEVTVARLIVPVHELKFADRYIAKEVADAMVKLKLYCRIDANSYRRGLR